MSEKPRRDFRDKQKKTGKKTFYKSIAKKDTVRNKSWKRVKKRNFDNELTGIYKQGQWAFGFVDTLDEKTWEKKWYFTHESKKLGAFEGDEVAFEVQYFKGREEALITKVLKRSEHLIVW